MKRIVIRTLGGENIGYGHYFRCLSLAKAISAIDKSIDILFIINEELEDLIINTGFKYSISSDLHKDFEVLENISPNFFVFDSYLGSNEYLKNIKEISKLMLIDDNNDIYDSSIPDSIYNGNIHAEKLNYKHVEGQIRLLGPKYLIMKEEYWDNNMDNVVKSGILVTTGGTDNYGITLNIIKKIKDIGVNIRVIIGLGYKERYIKEIEGIKTKNIGLIYKPNSLKEYIRTSKIVITAAGSTIYEVLSQRSVPIIFSIADNQDLLCQTLREKGVEYLGKYPSIDYSKLKQAIESLVKIDKKQALFELVDGSGAYATAKILISQIKD